MSQSGLYRVAINSTKHNNVANWHKLGTCRVRESYNMGTCVCACFPDQMLSMEVVSDNHTLNTSIYSFFSPSFFVWDNYAYLSLKKIFLYSRSNICRQQFCSGSFLAFSLITGFIIIQCVSPVSCGYVFPLTLCSFSYFFLCWYCICFCSWSL